MLKLNTSIAEDAIDNVKSQGADDVSVPVSQDIAPNDKSRDQPVFLLRQASLTGKREFKRKQASTTEFQENEWFATPASQSTVLVKTKKHRKKTKKTKNIKKPRDDLRKEKYTLKVMEEILNEREEMVTMHEHKLSDLKREYDQKLEKVNSRDRKLRNVDDDLRMALSNKNKFMAKIERLRKEYTATEDMIKERAAEIERLREEEMRWQMEISKKMRELKEYQKKFNSLASLVITVFLFTSRIIESEIPSGEAC